MSGNVKEWCQDHYDDYFFDRLKAQSKNNPINDPSRPNLNLRCVTRGGSYVSTKSLSRNSYRSANYPYNPLRNVGFRVSLFPL